MNKLVMAVALLVSLAVPAGANPRRGGGQVLRVHPAEKALMSLRQLEMAPFLSARSRMALAEARFDMQSVAWRAQRGFGGGFELDRVMARLSFVARDPNLSPFDRMRLSETAWTLRQLRFGGW